MGKVKNKNAISKDFPKVKSWWGSDVVYNPELDNRESIQFLSNTLEQANKILENLEFPKFDKEGNYLP